jgi:DNA-binding CsgD family transcriptional regulator
MSLQVGRSRSSPAKEPKPNKLDALFVRVANVLATASDLDDMIDAVVETLGTGLGVDRCMLGLYPPDIERYSFQYIWHGPGAPPFERITMLGVDRNPSFRLLLSGATYRCSDTSTDPRIADMRDFYKTYSIHSTMFHGLWRNGAWWGAVGMHGCSNLRYWTDEEARFLEAIADQIAMVIDLFRWRERARQSTHEPTPMATLPRPPTDRELAESGITAAERRVLRLVARGLTNAEIAGELNVSRRTVESHITSMLSKLVLRNRVELVRLFFGRDTGF